MECYQCGDDYTRLSLHWRRGDCDYPQITDKQREIAKGMVMGDAWVKHRENSPAQIRAEMNNKQFLEYLYEQMKPLSASVKMCRTAQENAERNGEKSSYGYNDSYLFTSRTAPAFNEFEEWYSSGKKVWPENLNLTPISLSVLYVCDGTLDGLTPTISCVKEQHRKEYVLSLFQSLGINASMKGHHIRLDTEQFFTVVGGPIKGFEHKWPESFKSKSSVLEDTDGRI